MADTVRAIFLILIGCYAIYLQTRSIKSTCFLFALVGPYAYFGASIGFVLTPAKLLGLIAFVSIFLNRNFKIYEKGSKFAYFVPYFVYIVIGTVLNSFFWPSFETNSQGFAYSNEGRWLVQLFLFVLGISLVLFLVRYIRSWTDVDKILSITLLSMLLMAICGLYVYVAQRYGLPFPSIARADGLGTKSEITTDVLGLKVVRAYSLSGEPKGLASDMILGITLLLFVPLQNKGYLVRKFRSMPIFLLMLLVLFLTYSTAGLVILPLAACLAGFILVMTRLEASAVGYVALFSILAGLVFTFTNFGEHIGNVITDRLFNRVNESGLNSFAEDAIEIVWSNNPLRLLFGAGLGGANFYIREVDSFTYAGKIAAPRGIYGFLADKGLVGLFLYGMGSFMCMRLIWREMKSNAAYFQLARGALVFLVIGNLLVFTKSGWYFEWLVVGLTIACANISSARTNRVES